MNYWAEETFVVRAFEPAIAHGRTFDLILSTDPEIEKQTELCDAEDFELNARCRCIAGHDHPHVRFAAELIAQTGVFAIGATARTKPDEVTQ